MKELALPSPSEVHTSHYTATVLELVRVRTGHVLQGSTGLVKEAGASQPGTRMVHPGGVAPDIANPSKLFPPPSTPRKSPWGRLVLLWPCSEGAAPTMRQVPVWVAAIL